MDVMERIADVRVAIRAARRAGRRIGLVPTMGALHAGHYSLLDAARRDGDFVAVSIFVNPTQFGPGEDLDAYPRSPEADRAGCRRRGVDLLFAPSVQEMYPDGPPATEVRVGGLSEALCGRSRPTHFAGVCLVVAKLLNIVQPDRAYFGRKDYQQLVIVRRMVRDLNLPVEIVGCPTVREADGLAVSSRNAYLTTEQRRQAPALHAALDRAREEIEERRPPAWDVIETVRAHLRAHAPDGEIDYVEIVDPRTLAPVESTDERVLVAAAVRLGRARLIDNVLVDAAGHTA